MKPCRVLIVDDSAYNRTTLARIVDADPEFEVVDTASDGEEGLRKLILHTPDIITLDLDMPRMDGFTFLRICMQKLPLPVIVVSSQHQPENVFKALELGALDFVSKPTQSISERIHEIGEELLVKLRAAHRSETTRLPRGDRKKRQPATKLAAPTAMSGLIIIGASTGGPGAIQQIFERLPVLPVGILIAQHMPIGFTKTFADRLNRISPYHAAEASGGELVSPGEVWVARGGKNMTVMEHGGVLRLRLESPKNDRYVPCVDKLFESAAKVKTNLLAVVLTGMGDDGAKGAASIRKVGGSLFVESEETAIVNGMPREAARAASADRVLSLQEFPKALEKWCRSLKSAGAPI